MIRLPETFTDRMKQMLGEAEFEEFLASYDRPREYGLRVNRMKCEASELPDQVPWELTPIPWVDNGFSYSGEIRPAQHPFYAAGVFYLQEPSAMTPASRLEINPGERVLDLCAAPGGKATELAARLGGTGLLVANDISNSRAKALLRNLELFGAGNIFVTNETPEKLSNAFPEYFDKILVDAPCSGEGMFRKDEAVIGTWSIERTQWFAAQQREIVGRACEMLRPGGTLLYSTCTFAPCEDEGTVSWVLEQYPDMKLIDMEAYEGFSEGVPQWGNGDPELKRCVRIWPHRMNGEGHFLALFHKDGGEDRNFGVPEDVGKKNKKNKKKKQLQKTEGAPDKEAQKLLNEFFAEVRMISIEGMNPEIRGEKVYLVPELPDTVRGLHFLRCGLYAGDLKKNRFEPSVSLAHGIRRNGFDRILSLHPEDERLEHFLKGETLVLKPEETPGTNGWMLVAVEGYPLGWGKMVNGVLKNHVPVSWRKS